MAPRVLVDATAVPADRGAVGRYVDGLVSALGTAGADLAVACQRSDEERYGRLVPAARIIAGPPAIAHRPARLAWEQSGLPLAAQQVSACGVKQSVVVELAALRESVEQLQAALRAVGHGHGNSSVERHHGRGRRRLEPVVQRRDAPQYRSETRGTTLSFVGAKHLAS